MSCCCNKLPPNTIISSAVTFTSPNLIINVPAGSYVNDGVYCLIVAQNVPSTTTVNAPVYITIGTGTVLYPIVKRDGTQLSAVTIAGRTKYKLQVDTTATSGVFRLLNKACCTNRDLTVINGSAPATATSETTSATS
jgi:hypothetical protein